MFGSAQPDTPFPSRDDAAVPEGSVLTGSTTPDAPSNFDGQELKVALQLLVERAQYITGATGAALAVTEGEGMVCRASAGSSGPAVGSRLQVHSGLSGESISRKQLLRCDNAATDPRVNLETCRELGIASIVVLPLLTRTGEVRGIFELFSDHAYAFEERDLIALERMAGLSMTALYLAEKRPRPVPTPAIQSGPAAPTLEKPKSEESENPIPVSPPDGVGQTLLSDPVALPGTQLHQPFGDAQVHSALFQEAMPEPAPADVVREAIPDSQLAIVPEAMRRVQKCATCGFPISEGRTLCIDCDNKSHQPPESADDTVPQFVPAFLNSPAPTKESWLANHVNVLAVAVLILSIVVAVVVFR